MKLIKADHFNDIFIKSINAINSWGEWTNPRGFDCKELISPQLILTNTENCLCTIKKRKLNYAYIVIEKMMFLTGISKPEILISYNKQMANYLNEFGEFDGAYGPRINGQLDFIYNELKKDKDSRRAVVTIHNRTDNNLNTKDSACTLSLQFLIRNNKLIEIATMRSNDIKWGTCIDIPVFCFFQEVLAYWLNIEKGDYIHNPASLHYYKEFEEELLTYFDFIDNYDIYLVSEVNNITTPKWDISYKDTENALKSFWKEEENIRLRRKFNKTKFKVINEYLDILLKYWLRKDEKGVNHNKKEA